MLDSTLGILIDREIEKIKRAPIKQVAQSAEPNQNVVMENLIRAEMPKVRRDAKELQRVAAENELVRRNAEAARSRAIATSHVDSDF